MTQTLQLQVTVLRSAAQHQADAMPCLVSEEDYSGSYRRVNRSTLYCVERSAYLELSPEGMARAARGEPLRVSSRCVS